MQNLLDELTKTLGSDDRLVINGKLAKNKIIELALAVDESLIKLILKNDALKKNFFREVVGILVFDKIEFNNNSFSIFFSVTYFSAYSCMILNSFFASDFIKYCSLRL